MNTKIEVFVGAPIELESERLFLAQLCKDLKASGTSALIFANFLVPPHRPRQIDFLIVLEDLVCLIELKCITAPVVGEINGVWKLVSPNGCEQPFHGNPYRQALECKFALSDHMHQFAKRRPLRAKRSSGEKFYRQIESVVCVYPSLQEGSKVPSDSKVRVWGYSELVRNLVTRKLSPDWSMSDWIGLAMDLGLVREEQFNEPEGLATAEETLSRYGDSFSGDYILGELLKVDDPATLPAFVRYTRNLDANSCYQQEVAGNFMNGHVGCARYSGKPSQLEDVSTDDRRAWQCYGELIFWVHKPGLQASEIVERCEPIWNSLFNELAAAAVDPLMRLAHAHGYDMTRTNIDPIQSVIGMFRHEIRRILTSGLQLRSVLTSLGARFEAHFGDHERMTFMVHTLGQLGDNATISLLRPLIEDSRHGEDAVEAIRRIQTGAYPERITFLRRFG